MDSAKFKALRNNIKRRVLVWLLGVLPKWISGPFIRSQLDLSYEPVDGLVIKVAETHEELEQAYKVLYESYLAAGLIDPNSSGIRLTKYHALPTTTTCVIKLHEEVIGTFSIILDGPMGLPVTHVSDIENIRKNNARVGEVSSLAIRKESKMRRNFLLFPVLKFLYHYAEKHAGIDALTMVVNRSAKTFYEAMFQFKSLKVKKGIDYEFVNAKEICPLYVEFNFNEENSTKSLMEKIYGDNRPNQNIYHYVFVYLNDPQLYISSNPKKIQSHEYFNREYLQKFFVEHTDLINEMEGDSRKLLSRVLDLPLHLTPFLTSKEQYERYRKHRRYMVNMKSIVLGLERGEYKEKFLENAEIIALSKGGVQLHWKKELALGDHLRILVPMEDFCIDLRLVLRSKNSVKFQYGFQITGGDLDRWLEISSEIENEFFENFHGKITNLRLIS